MSNTRYNADLRFYARAESHFYLLGDAVPDAVTMERYRIDDAVWQDVLAGIQTQLDTMLRRAEVWSRTFGDRDSARDITDLDGWNVVLAGYGLADRQAMLPRQLVYRLKVSMQRAFDEDLGVYRRRAASAQSLALSWR